MIFSAEQRQPSGADGTTLAQDISSHCEAVHGGAEIRHFVMAITVERGMPHRNQRRALALPCGMLVNGTRRRAEDSVRPLSLKVGLSHMGIGRKFQLSCGNPVSGRVQRALLRERNETPISGLPEIGS